MGDHLQRGRCLRLRSFKTHNLDGAGWTRYTAPTGEVFVAILIGVEPLKGGEPLDPKRALREMGWTPAPEVEIREVFTEGEEKTDG